MHAAAADEPSSCAPAQCLTCKNPQSYVVDAATGRCRAATCTERDAQCASCSWWGTCAACKQAGWVVDWYSKKVGRGKLGTVS